MPTIAAVGQSFALDGREACIQALEQARQKILHEADNIILALVFAPKEYGLPGILSGAQTQFRNIPIIGFSTENQLTVEGQSENSIVVALLAGSDISVQADWWPDFPKDSQATIQYISETFGLSTLVTEKSPPTLIVYADGIEGNGEHLCQHLPKGGYQTVGGLTGSNLRHVAYQIGGTTGGESGLAAALIQGKLKTGVGVAHGWQPIGKYFQITQTEDLKIQTLNNQPASEAYATLFGHQARDWTFPPLSTLIRLYPLALENKDHLAHKIRSPLQVEADGSFRMTVPIQEGLTGHLLVGSMSGCIEAARNAAQQAMDSLGTARPILALVFVDIAWKMLFETQPGGEIAPIHEILGENIPIAGGYTVGQIYTGPSGVELLNQHIEVVLFGAID